MGGRSRRQHVGDEALVPAIDGEIAGEARNAGSSASRARRRARRGARTIPRRARAGRSAARGRTSAVRGGRSQERTARRPAIRNAVSTMSPPSSSGPNGMTRPVLPSRKCGKTPWNRSAISEEAEDQAEAVEEGGRRNPAALHTRQHRHQAKARAADGHGVGPVRSGHAAVEGEAAGGMRGLPEIGEAGALGEIEQRRFATPVRSWRHLPGRPARRWRAGRGGAVATGSC